MQRAGRLLAILVAAIASVRSQVVTLPRSTTAHPNASAAIAPAVVSAAAAAGAPATGSGTCTFTVNASDPAGIQGALSSPAANNCSEISMYLGPGTFKGTNNTNLVITKTTSIMGAGPISSASVIDAQAGAFLFDVKSTTLTLQQLTLQNGARNSHGGAVSVSGAGGKLSATHVDFMNHTATTSGGDTAGGQGGAVYLSAGTLAVFTNCFWESCEAKGAVKSGISCKPDDTQSFPGAQGGAVYAADANEVSFSNCTFHSCSAEGSSNCGIIAGGHGGAVYLSGTSSETATFSDGCSFRYNTAGAGQGEQQQYNTEASVGGAIYIVDMQSVSIQDSVFETNVADCVPRSGSYGGALYIQSCAMTTLSGCQFTNNTAPACDDALKTSGGGAVCTFTSAFTFKHTNFSGNTAVQGGALWSLAPSTGSVPVHSTCENCIFDGNAAKATGSIAVLGGAMYIELWGVRNTFGFSSCTFANNYALGNPLPFGASIARGGAIYVHRYNYCIDPSSCQVVEPAGISALSVQSSLFSGNYVDGTTGGGGALALSTGEAEASVLLRGCTLRGNEVRGANQHGAAIWQSGSQTNPAPTAKIVLEPVPGSNIACALVDNVATGPALATAEDFAKDDTPFYSNDVMALLTGPDATAFGPLNASLPPQVFASQGSRNEEVSLAGGCFVNLSCHYQLLVAGTQAESIGNCVPDTQAPTPVPVPVPAPTPTPTSAGTNRKNPNNQQVHTMSTGTVAGIAIACTIILAAVALLFHRRRQQRRSEIGTKRSGELDTATDSAYASIGDMDDHDESRHSTRESIDSDRNTVGLRGRGRSFIEMALNSAASPDTATLRKAADGDMAGAGGSYVPPARTTSSLPSTRDSNRDYNLLSQQHRRSCSDDSAATGEEQKAHSRVKTAAARTRKSRHSGVTKRITGGAETISTIPWRMISLGARISSGSAGVVYRATYSGTAVAVKELVTLSYWLAGSEAGGIDAAQEDEYTEASEAFFREAMILSSLQHPNIVTFFGVAVRPPDTTSMMAGPSFFLVTELCGGALPSLFDVAEPETDSEADLRTHEYRLELRRIELLRSGLVLSIVRQIAGGMLYLHSNDVLHRDLKPDNVLLKEVFYGQQPQAMWSGSNSRGGASRSAQFNTAPTSVVAKLCDFGLGTVWRAANDDTNSNSRRRSGKNTGNRKSKSKSKAVSSQRDMTGMVGTPNYMAPELMAMDQGSATGAIDVFSFGILLWSIYTGKSPHAERDFGSIHALFREVLREGLRPPVPPHMPKPLMKLMVDCWAQQPAQRPSFAEINERLQDPDGLGIGARLAESDNRSSSELFDREQTASGGHVPDDDDGDASLVRIPTIAAYNAAGSKVHSRNSSPV